MSTDTTSEVSAKTVVVWGGAAAVAAVVAATMTGFFAAASFVLALFLGAVAAGIGLSVLIDAVSRRRSRRSRALQVRLRAAQRPDRCSGCGSSMVHRLEVRICALCDRAPAT